MANNIDIKSFTSEVFNSKRVNDHFPGIRVGDFILSIQGSTHAYSVPQKDYYKLSDYDKLEVAIFDKQKQWVSPQSDERLKHFEWAKLFEENECPVAGYVTIPQIERIIENLLFLFGQCMN